MQDKKTSKSVLNPKLQRFKSCKYLGNFKDDDIDTSEYGRLSKRAIKLADRVGWQ